MSREELTNDGLQIEKISKFSELCGKDAFFYKCSRVIMYVYDKQHVIHDVDNFIQALVKR